MSRLKEIARLLIFRITVIWHSVLSWMRWRQRAQAKEHQQKVWLAMELQLRLDLHRELLLHQLEDRQERLLHLAEISQRALLMEALLPLADALKRQDNLHSQRHQEEIDLLLEALNSLQPSPELLISRELGLLPLTRSSPS